MAKDIFNDIKQIDQDCGRQYVDILPEEPVIMNDAADPMSRLLYEEEIVDILERAEEERLRLLENVDGRHKAMTKWAWQGYLTSPHSGELINILRKLNCAGGFAEGANGRRGWRV